MDQDRAGKVLLVTLDGADGGPATASVEERQVGRTLFQRLEVEAATVGSQAALMEGLLKGSNPDLVLDVQLIGVRPDALDLDIDEVESGLRDAFFRVRVRDRSVPALTEGVLPSPDTIAGAFLRDVEAQIAELEASADVGAAQEMRDVLRLGRLLLAGEEVSL